MSRAKTVSIDKNRVLKELRELGMSQKLLAELIGMNHQALCRALSVGKTSESMFMAMCREMNCSPEYLEGVSDHNHGLNPIESRPEWKEDRPRFMYADKDFFIWTPEGTYTSLDRIISLACKYGFCDHIKEMLDRDTSERKDK